MARHIYLLVIFTIMSGTAQAETTPDQRAFFHSLARGLTWCFESTGDLASEYDETGECGASSIWIEKSDNESIQSDIYYVTPQAGYEVLGRYVGNVRFLIDDQVFCSVYVDYRATDEDATVKIEKQCEQRPQDSKLTDFQKRFLEKLNAEADLERDSEYDLSTHQITVKKGENSYQKLVEHAVSHDDRYGTISDLDFFNVPAYRSDEYRRNVALDRLFKTMDRPFFCYRLFDVEERFTSEDCRAKTKDLLNTLVGDMADESVLYISDLEGDYYGNNRTVTLFLGPKFDQVYNAGEDTYYIAVEFDILHEI